MAQTNSERMNSVSRAFVVARTLFITTVIALSVLIATGMKICHIRSNNKGFILIFI